MSTRNQYTAQQFIDAIPGTGGVITSIARRVGCDWHTAKKYLTEYPTITRAWDNEREGMLDMAEVALFKAVKDGEQWAVKFFLTTIGKQRGYVERVEQQVSGTGDGGAIVLTWADTNMNDTDTD